MPDKQLNIYTVLSLFLVLIIDSMGIGLVMPLIGPLFISKTSAFVAMSMTAPTRDLLYGITMGIFCVFMFFGSPLLGDISDHIGRKKSLLFCLLGTAFGLAISAIGVDIDSATLLIAGRAIAGFMAGSQALAQAAIIDMSPQHRKTINLGLISVAACVGFVLGPIFAGILSDKHLWSGFSFATPFWIAAGLALINAGALLFTFRETFTPKTLQRIKLTKGIQVFISAFSNKTIRKLALIYLLAEAGFALYFQFLPLYLIDAYNYSAAQISHTMAVMGIVFGVTMLVVVRIIEKYMRVERLMVSMIVVTAIGSFMVLLHSELALWLSLIPVAFGGGLFYVAILTAFSNSVGPEQQGWAMGIFTAVVAISWSFSGLFSGLLGMFNIYIPFAIAGILLLLSAIFFSFSTNLSKKAQ